MAEGLGSDPAIKGIKIIPMKGQGALRLQCDVSQL